MAARTTKVRLCLLLAATMHASVSRAATTVKPGQPNICLLTAGTQIAAEGYREVNAGRFAKGQSMFQTALAYVEQDDRENVSLRACLMGMIGFTEFQQRQPRVAMEWILKALALHPLPASLTAVLNSNLAAAYLETGDLDNAGETARKALRFATDAFGPDHPETLSPQVTVGTVLVLRGDYDRAEPVLRRVLHHTRKVWGADSYEASMVTGNLAWNYVHQRRYSQAQVHFEKCLSILQNHPKRARDEVPFMQAGLATSYAAGNRPGEARMLLTRALDTAEREMQTDYPSFPELIERLAQVHFLLKDCDAGMQMYERALEMLSSRHGAGSQLVLACMERYSDLLRGAGEKKIARDVENRRKALALAR